jgi:hypothetical protein
MQDVIRQIAESEADGGTANLVLDLRVQPGEAASAQSLVEFRPAI